MRWCSLTILLLLPLADGLRPTLLARPIPHNGKGGQNWFGLDDFYKGQDKEPRAKAAAPARKTKNVTAEEVEEKMKVIAREHLPSMNELELKHVKDPSKLPSAYFSQRDSRAESLSPSRAP